MYSLTQLLGLNAQELNDSSHGREGEDGKALSNGDDTQSNIGGRQEHNVDDHMDVDDTSKGKLEIFEYT